MGMIVFVYRNNIGSDCTLGGISSKADKLTLVNVDGPFEPTPERPAALLVQGNLQGTLKIVPAIQSPQSIPNTWVKVPNHTMFGGNYAATSDSRFSQACEAILGHRFYGAVAIHDRIE